MSRPRTPVLKVFLALLPLILFLPAPAIADTASDTAAAASAKPVTIPSLQEWTAGTGLYSFTGSSRVVVDSAHGAQLATTADVFADDLSKLLGGATVGRVTAAAPQAGDIFLTLGSTDTRHSAHTLTVGSAVTIRGAADDGVFYGTRSVLQLLKQSRTIPAGTATDWAQQAERGLMVDVGRKYFTVPWLQQHIKDLAYAKMNYLHLHLSDNKGFRIESSTHPEVVSSQHYTKQEISDLIALAAKYHITVVPEIDVPGHLDPVLAAHPELKLTDSSGNASPTYIDLSKPAAYTLIQDLIEEYLPLFPAKYWHLGADEYVTDYSKYPQLLAYARAHHGANATAKDTYYAFINWANSLVRASGKTMRMWNDGIKSGDGTINPDANIIVEYWYKLGLTPQQLLDRGHTLVNASWTPTYYVFYNNPVGAKPDVKYMYESWNPGIFEGVSVPAGVRNLGSKLHVWCDQPAVEREYETAAGIHAPLRTLAQQTWGSPKPVVTYAEFQPLITAVGRAPGWPNDTDLGNLALGRPVTASSTETPTFPATATVDGIYGSRWSSAYADPQWVQIDLGATRQIGRVKLTWENAHAKAFQIQTSNDASNWTTIHSTTTATGGVQDLNGLSGSGRYLRLYLTQRSSSFGYSLWEVEAYSPDLALGRPVTASSTETPDFTAAMAVDGNRASRWSSAYADPQWIRIDLGATRQIGRVLLSWERAYARAFQVQVSDDGSAWTTIHSTTTSAGGVQDLTGLSGSGRYLRVHATQRGTSYGYSLWEVKAFA